MSGLFCAMIKREANMSKKSAVIELVDVSVSYKSRGFTGRVVAALGNVSFTLDEGSALGIIGASGSGKTTLALVSAGLLRPTTGTVKHFGKLLLYRIFSLSRVTFPAQMVFQNPLPP
jgi:ABC-type glutathione transport system ATPase component